MESQESTNITADATSARGPHVVKSNVPISPGFQPRPQGPYGSGRQPLNNGPIEGPRQVGPPAQIRRLDSRTSFGPLSPGQFVRSYGPPRPPGNIFPQRPSQPNQNPQNAAILLNPRCPPSPGLRGPGPQQGPRPPYLGNPHGQQFQRGNIQRPQQPRPELSNQNGPLQHSQNPESGTPRAGQESFGQKQFQRNESSLNILRQNPPSNVEENKQINRPRIIIDKMADVDKTKPQQPEDNIQKKKADVRENGENDDDDDVVMDNEKSPRANGNAAYDNQGFVDKSKTPEMPKKLEEPVQSVKRPGTATIDSKLITKPNEVITDKIEDSTSRALSAKSDKSDKPDKPVEEALNICNANNVEQKLTAVTTDDKIQSKEPSNSSEVKQPSNTETVVDKVEEDKTKSLTIDTTSNKPKSPVSKATEERKDDITEASSISRASTPAVIENSQNEQSLKAPTETPDKSRSSAPAEMKQTHEEELKAASKSSNKSPTPTISVEESQNKKESESPSKSFDKTRSNTPTDAIQSSNKDETKSPSNFPDIQTSTPKVDHSKDIKSEISNIPENKAVVDNSKDIKSEISNIPENKAVVDNSKDIKSEISNIPENKAVVDNAIKSKTEVDNLEKCSMNAVSEAAKSEVTNSSENQHRDKSAGNSLEVNDAIGSALKSASSDKGGRKSPKSPTTPEENQLSVSGSVSSPLRSSQESVKGFDNGQRRSLSSRSSPCRSPQSSVFLKSSKSPTEVTQSIGNEKKKTTFAEDSITKKDSNDKGDQSKPTTLENNIQRAPTPAKLDTGKKSTKKQEVENGTATNDSSQSSAVPTTNGVGDSPTKKSPSKSRETDKRSTAGSPVKSPSKSTKSLPRTPETPSSTAAQEKKKVPMNKIQVGSAPSPNLKTVRSKIGSLENASYKPGGGKVKIENRKLDFSKAQPKIAAKNEKYTPSGGDKKIAQVKLQWNAKPKVGSLENATYKPGGGDKKIETVKLDFKDKAKPKVGSKDNAKHVPGGGAVKSSATPPKTPQDTSNDIQTQKIDIKAESKIGSLDNVKHKPGGGDKKIFNDKDYLRQTGSNVESLSGSGSQVQTPEENNPDSSDRLSKDDSPQPPPSTPIKIRNLASPTSVVTPRAVRNGLAKSPETPGSKRSLTSLAEVSIPLEGNKKDPKTEVTQSKNTPRDKMSKSPSTPRPPSSLRLKSPEKSSPASPRKSSPKELRLPKLAPSPVAQDANPVTDTHSKLTLPKLIGPSSQSTRVAY